MLDARAARRRLRDALPLALRGGVAGGLAAFAALKLGMTYPIYALIAAVVITDPSPDETRRLGLQRLLATLLGAAFGGFFDMIAPGNLWMMALCIFLAMLLCYAAGLSSAARMAGYISGIIVLSHGDSPWTYAGDRLLETLIGLFFAFALSRVVWPLPARRAKSR